MILFTVDSSVDEFLHDLCVFCSKVKEMEGELHVVTNNLRSLEIVEGKVRFTNEGILRVSGWF